MKRLVFIRHGKSSWKGNLDDLERPLKPRGVNDLLLISKELKQHNIEFDAIFASPAKRTLQTSVIILKELEISFDILHKKEELYDFSGESVVDFVKSLGVNYDNILIFGHNNALTNIANSFGDKFIDNIPTSGMVVLEFDIANWSAITSGKTIDIIFPRDLK